MVTLLNLSLTHTLSPSHIPRRENNITFPVSRCGLEKGWVLGWVFTFCQIGKKLAFTGKWLSLKRVDLW